MRTGNLGRNYYLIVWAVPLQETREREWRFLVENKKEEEELLNWIESKGYCIVRIRRER